MAGTLLAPPKRVSKLATRTLPKWTPIAVLIGSVLLSVIVFALLAAADESEFNAVGAGVIAALIYAAAIVLISGLIEGSRKAMDRWVTTLVIGAFIVAMLPLISVTTTVLANGLARFDAEFFGSSMRGVTGEGGGALHAILGTVQITLAATVISIPIGILTAIYLVEYGRGRIAKGITFIVDVMTGIPSIVAGLFAYALFVLMFGPAVRMGFAGSVALTVLMIPVIVRSSEEMIRLVPNELREASLALGVPKWLTILKVVLPTSIAGIATGVMLSIARVIGETAPLLVTAGFTDSMNYNLFSERMNSLPLYVYNSYMNQGIPPEAYIDRAWAGALTLILIVMILNLVARLVAKIFAPKVKG